LSEARNGKGTLYLIPVDLGGGDPRAVLPGPTLEAARRLGWFVVENAKTARAFLKQAGHPRPLRELHLGVLDEHGAERAMADALARLATGEDCGLLSEAGCPAVADPGAVLVRRAHEAGVRVVPLVGPSSILLALMASGMDGQRFAFHGYLPADSARRAARAKELEVRASAGTQVFIETPHRSPAMLATLLETCRPDTLLCIAADLTLPTELVETRAIAAWKKKPPDLSRRPVVFLLWRGAGG
jgi:16S rRNA (cytidine1402-2'-O)-methyltransferase